MDQGSHSDGVNWPPPPPSEIEHVLGGAGDDGDSVVQFEDMVCWSLGGKLREDRRRVWKKGGGES